MLEYNEQNQALEINREICERYIFRQLQKNQSWNETQLTLIVETLVNFINSALEIYKFYPGSAIKLLEKLARINTAKEDKQNQVLDKIIAMGKDNRPLALRCIRHDIPKIYQMCIGILDGLRLEKLQSTPRISEAQKQATHDIINDLLQAVITDIQESTIYKNAQAEKSLFFNKQKLTAKNPLFWSRTLPKLEELAVPANTKRKLDRKQDTKKADEHITKKSRLV